MATVKPQTHLQKRRKQTASSPVHKLQWANEKNCLFCNFHVKPGGIKADNKHNQKCKILKLLTLYGLSASFGCNSEHNAKCSFLSQKSSYCRLIQCI